MVVPFVLTGDRTRSDEETVEGQAEKVDERVRDAERQARDHARVQQALPQPRPLHPEQAVQESDERDADREAEQVGGEDRAPDPAEGTELTAQAVPAAAPLTLRSFV